MGLLTRRLTKEEARAELKAAKEQIRQAVQHDASVNMARPGSATDYPESEQYVAAAERLKKARRAVRRAR